jgi:hypothetical protein
MGEEEVWDQTFSRRWFIKEAMILGAGITGCPTIFISL